MANLIGEGAGSGEQLRPFAADYIEHAHALYAGLRAEYEAAPADPAVAERLDKATALMCEYAVDTNNGDLAWQAYNDIKSPVKKWEMVTKAYTAGKYITAAEWQAPLEVAIGWGEYTTLDLLAMYKAKAAMAFHRISFTDDSTSAVEIEHEIENIWSEARTLLTAVQGKELAPRRSADGYSDNQLPPELDVRSHLLDFAKLYAANGKFDKAEVITNKIAYISSYSSGELGPQDESLHVEDESRSFAHTLELRRLTQGLDAAAVLKHAKRWARDGQETVTRDVGELLSNPYASTFGLLRPDGWADAYGFIEQTYPSLRVDKSSGYPMYGHRLPVLLKAGEWVSAMSHYEHRLEFGGPLESLENALLVARYGQQMDESAVLASTEADIYVIRSVAADWKSRAAYLDTSQLPGKVREVGQWLDASVSRVYYPAALQHRVFRALLEVQTQIDPDSTSIKARIETYAKRKFRVLSKIPNAENTIPGQLADLRALAAEAGIEL